MHSTSKMMRYFLLSMVFIFSIQTIHGGKAGKQNRRPSGKTQFKISGSPLGQISMDNIAPKVNVQVENDKLFTCLKNGWTSTNVPQAQEARELIVGNYGGDLYHKSAVVISSKQDNTFCWIVGQGKHIKTMIQDGSRVGIVYKNRSGLTNETKDPLKVQCATATQILAGGVVTDETTDGFSFSPKETTVTMQFSKAVEQTINKDKDFKTKKWNGCDIKNSADLEGTKKPSQPTDVYCNTFNCPDNHKNTEAKCVGECNQDTCCKAYNSCSGAVTIKVNSFKNVPEGENNEESRRLGWEYLEDIEYFDDANKAHGETFTANCDQITTLLVKTDGGEERRLGDDEEEPTTANYRKFNTQELEYKCKDGKWEPVQNECQDGTPNSAYGWGFLTAGTVWFVLFLIFHF